MQNTANLMSFNYSRNFNSPLLPHTMPTRHQQTSFQSRNSINTDSILNGGVGSNEDHHSVDYAQQQNEACDDSTNPPLYNPTNVIPSYPFHTHHPMHYPFYTYPPAEMSSLPSSILPYSNNYHQYHLGKSSEDISSSKESIAIHDAELDAEKTSHFAENIDFPGFL